MGHHMASPYAEALLSLAIIGPGSKPMTAHFYVARSLPSLSVSSTHTPRSCRADSSLLCGQLLALFLCVRHIHAQLVQGVMHALYDAGARL